MNSASDVARLALSKHFGACFENVRIVYSSVLKNSMPFFMAVADDMPGYTFNIIVDKSAKKAYIQPYKATNIIEINVGEV